MKGDLSAEKLGEVLAKARESFGDNLPVVMHDGEHFRDIGRISVLEVPQFQLMALVLRMGDPTKMKGRALLEPLADGKVPREGDDDWLKTH